MGITGRIIAKPRKSSVAVDRDRGRPWRFRVFGFSIGTTACAADRRPNASNEA